MASSRSSSSSSPSSPAPCCIPNSVLRALEPPTRVDALLSPLLLSLLLLLLLLLLLPPVPAAMAAAASSRDNAAFGPPTAHSMPAGSRSMPRSHTEHNMGGLHACNHTMQTQQHAHTKTCSDAKIGLSVLLLAALALQPNTCSNDTVRPLNASGLATHLGLPKPRGGPPGPYQMALSAHPCLQTPDPTHCYQQRPPYRPYC